MEISSELSENTIIVAKDGTGNYTTIQDGVDAASRGDTVRVWEGVYKEAVRIGKSITLIGNGTVKSILDGDGTLDHQHLFEVSSDGVNITGFQFREGSPHHEFAGIGIYASEVMVYGNFFLKNTNGIYIAGGPDNVISNNTFDMNSYGIRSDAGCDGNFIKYNDFNGSLTGGIIYMGARDVTILRNNFTHNRYHLSLYNSYDYDIGHNRFIGANPGMSGIMIGSSTGNDINNNTFMDNDVALSMTTGAHRNKIILNRFENNNQGIRTTTTVDKVEAHQNSFVNNALWGINFSASSSIINAKYNWWGNYTGPNDPVSNPSGTGDNVSVNVSYDPWLTGEFVNKAPILQPIGDQYALEDSLFDMGINASDPDGHGVVFRVESNASWMDFNSTSLNITGRPDNLDVGIYFINVNISDGWGGYDEENFTLTVNNTPPVILSENIPNATEDEDFHFFIEYEEEIGSSWNISTNAYWLYLDPIEISLSGTPLNDDVGDFFVLLNYSDGNGGYDEVNLSASVIGVDDPPRIVDALENIEIMEDETFVLDLSGWVEDVDNELTDYTFRTLENISISFDPVEISALIVPKANWSGYDIAKFSVTGGGISVTQSIMIDVLPVNDAPWNVSIESPIGSITEGENFYLNGSADDPDIPYGDRLNYSWYSNISGSLGNGHSLYLNLSPGTHEITLNVSDRSGDSAFSTIKLNISFIVDDEEEGNDTVPTNDTDDNTTKPDDQTPDDNTTEPDDDTTDDNTTEPDDQVDGDDVIDQEEDDGGDDMDLYLLIAFLVVFFSLMGLLFIASRKEEEDEEIMSWEEE